MVTKNYRFADVAFTLQMQYPYLEKQVKDGKVLWRHGIRNSRGVCSFGNCSYWLS